MKRHSNLYEVICSPDNIRLAHQNARKGKTHYREVKMVDAEPDKYIQEIVDMLTNKTYRVGEYDVFTRKVDSGKVRKIYRLSYYPHRIVHHAILQVVEPIWINSFIAETYCCIKGRGIHKAMKRLQYALRSQKPKYCLKIDIEKFYPSCDNETTKKIVRRKIKDKDLLWLLDEIIDSAEGLPIGNYMSQYLANVYLSPFDWFCKQTLRTKHYYRYCDDIVILSDSKEELRGWLKQIESYLLSIKLKVKDKWQIFPVATRGIDFLGYRFFHGYTLLRKNIAKKALKLSRRIQIKDHASLSGIRSLMSYYGWMVHANTMNLRKKVYNNKIYKLTELTTKEKWMKNPLKGKL